MIPSFGFGSTSQLLEEMDLFSLSGKCIGYYTGSFDPFHEGHKKLIGQILQEKLVDYVIVYPVPGGDQYKNRSDWALRRKMVQLSCKTHPQVICTHLMPKKVQEFLRPCFGKSDFVGIIGSDVVIDQLSDPDEAHRQKVSKVFLRGLTIPEKHAETTIGAIMAIPCKSVIVSLREGADLSHLNGLFEDRPIRAFIRLDPPYSHLSSTKVRESIRFKLPISEGVDPIVKGIIIENQLYRDPQ